MPVLVSFLVESSSHYRSRPQDLAAPTCPRNDPEGRSKATPVPGKQNRGHATQSWRSKLSDSLSDVCLRSPDEHLLRFRSSEKQVECEGKYSTVIEFSIGRSASDSAIHSMPIASSVEIAMTEQATLLVCRHTINIFPLMCLLLLLINFWIIQILDWTKNVGFVILKDETRFHKSGLIERVNLAQYK